MKVSGREVYPAIGGKSTRAHKKTNMTNIGFYIDGNILLSENQSEHVITAYCDIPIVHHHLLQVPQSIPALPFFALRLTLCN